MWLLVAILVVGLSRTLLEPLPVDPRLPTWFGPVVGGITFLVMALLAWAIATGRRWALVVSVILLIVGLPTSVPFLQEQSVGGLLVFGGQTLAGAVAYALLFTYASRQWFRASQEFRTSKRVKPSQASKAIP